MKFRSFVFKLVCLVSGVLLFSLSQPSSLFSHGLAPLAFVALLPYFLLAFSCTKQEAILWGGIYGALSYSVLVFWLFSFSRIAFCGIVILYFLFFAFLTPLISMTYRVFGNKAFFAAWILYMSYEFVKTSGFLGFSYGVIAYSQWQFLPLIRIASIFGVWAVSALLVFPSAFLAVAMMFARDRSEEEIRSVKTLISRTGTFIVRKKFVVLGYGLVFLLSFLPFFMQQQQTGTSYRIALIQPNSDPWKNTFSSYEEDLNTLIDLSKRAMDTGKTVDMLVWPETAFIPRIKWHYKFRSNARMYALVDKLLTFIETSAVSVLIGNDEALYDPAAAAGNTAPEAGRVDYNAALFFTPDTVLRPPEPQSYYKQHLVPFTEHFPYKNMFPFVYEWLSQADTHLYEAGTEATVFRWNDLKISVPICFEDNFGSLTRNFAKNGANILINISNDAWAKSEACLLQHLSTSVFRAVETGLPMLRSTANGITCAISPSGKILKSIPPFAQGFLIVECEVPEKANTAYLKIGDALAYAFLCGGIALIVYCLIRRFTGRKNDKEK